MILDTVVLTLFTCLTVTTWLSAERNPAFLRSLNTTLVYMKFIVFLYSCFSESYILVASILLDLIQGYTNFDKEIQEDNELLFAFGTFCVANICVVTFLLHQESSVALLTGHLVRVLYVIQAVGIEDATHLVVFLFLGHELLYFNSNDEYVLVRLSIIFVGVIFHFVGSFQFAKAARDKYIYNDKLLPGSFVKAVVREEDLISNETYDLVINRAKSFASYLRYSEPVKVNSPPATVIPDVISALRTLQVSIDKHSGDDATTVVTWVNMTKHSLIFYVQNLLNKEQDENKRLIYKAFLLQNDPTRFRPTTTTTTAHEPEEEEAKVCLSEPNQEETISTKEETSGSEEEEVEDASSGEEEEDISSEQQIL